MCNAELQTHVEDKRGVTEEPAAGVLNRAKRGVSSEHVTPDDVYVAPNRSSNS